MQHTPVVRLPEEKHPMNWGLLIAALAIVAIVVFAVMMLANPTLLVGEPPISNYPNPEVSQAARYMETHAAAAVPGPTNPELSSALRYQEQISNDQFLRENPEIRRFWQSKENQ